MSIKIYVGNLFFNSDEGELRGLFESHGVVDFARIIVDQFTNRSRGFGFIEMENREEGLRAIQELDSKDLGGRSLNVNEASPRPIQMTTGAKREDPACNRRAVVSM
jgi:RNA recognition motif-containing protein